MEQKPQFKSSDGVDFLDGRKAIMGTRIVAFGVAIFLCFSSLAIPKKLRNYDVLPGGLTIIQDGAFVEGSLSSGGIQPDYQIDLQREPLKSLLEKARGIGQLKRPYWDKVGLVVELIREDFFKYTDYYNPYYRRLLKRFRETKKDIPLSEYGSCNAGVCREHALVLHFALTAAGIENKHAYGQIYRASSYDNYEVIEDHAFTVVERRGVQWVVDAYYWGFNGFRLSDLLSEIGITERSRQAPIAAPGPGRRRIIKINDFPKIYNPKPATLSCAGVLK